MDWSEHYKDGKGFRDWPNEELVRFLSRQQPGDWLEVGCGGGGNLRVMSAVGLTATGVDTNTDALAHANLLRTGEALVLYGDAFKVDDQFGSQAFDGVVDCMVSQHVPWKDHLRLYEGYRAVLKPGGWFWCYHLEAATMSRSVKPEHASAYPYFDRESLSLFPTVNSFCLPLQSRLHEVIEQAGFNVQPSYRIAREYPDGQVATYAVVEATAV